MDLDICAHSGIQRVQWTVALNNTLLRSVNFHPRRVQNQFQQQFIAPQDSIAQPAALKTIKIQR